MRTSKNAMVAGISLLILTACGSSEPTTPSTQGSTSCSAGQVYNLQYGCLAQSTCPSGYGMYNNSCVATITPSAGYPTPAPCPAGSEMYNNTCVSVARTSAAPSCQPGTYFIMSIGCLPEAHCGNGFVLYQNTCYRLVSPRGYTYSKSRTYGGAGWAWHLNLGF